MNSPCIFPKSVFPGPPPPPQDATKGALKNSKVEHFGLARLVCFCDAGLVRAFNMAIGAADLPNKVGMERAISPKLISSWNPLSHPHRTPAPAT